MAEKLKMLMDIFGKITFGVLIAAAVFISVFEGVDAQISVKILWQILAVSAVCSVPVLMFDSDASKEPPPARAQTRKRHQASPR